jgi:hypothetical protein
MKNTIHFLTILFVTIAFGLILQSCGANCILPIEGEVVQSDGDPPRWICEEAEITRHDGVKYFTYIAHGTGARIETAESSAKGKAAALAAESINNRVLSLLAEASETLGDAYHEQYEQARIEVRAYKAKVQVIGQARLDVWWAKMQEELKPKPIYHYWIWSGIPFKEYKQLKAIYMDHLAESYPDSEKMAALLDHAREINEEPAE